MTAVIAALDAYAAAFLAVLLFASAAHKAMDPRRLGASAVKLTRLDAAWGAPAIAAAAIAEAAAGLALIPPATRAAGALGAAAVWSLYVLLIWRALAAGRSDIDCGCTFGPRHAPLGRWEIGRDLTLVALALMVAAGLAPRPAIGPLEWLAGLGLLMLYAALDQVRALTPRTAWR